MIRVLLRNTVKSAENWLLRVKWNLSPFYSIEKNVKLRHATLGPYVSLGESCDVTASTIGKYTYLGSYSYLPFCKIGKFCSIASWVKLAAGMHPVNFVSTHPATYSENRLFSLGFSGGGGSAACFSEYVYSDATKKYYCEIGSDVWIATGVLLVCGRSALHIGHGAILRAGSVVCHDVPPYAVVQGSPARVVGYRFDPATIEQLLAVCWWDQPEQWLRERIDLFPYLEKFLLNIKLDRKETNENGRQFFQKGVVAKRG